MSEAKTSSNNKSLYGVHVELNYEALRQLQLDEDTVLWDVTKALGAVGCHQVVNGVFICDEPAVPHIQVVHEIIVALHGATWLTPDTARVTCFEISRSGDVTRAVCAGDPPATRIARVLSAETPFVRFLTEGGSERQVDLSPLFKWPWYEALADPAYFAQAAPCGYGLTIGWPEGELIPPEYLDDLCDR